MGQLAVSSEADILSRFEMVHLLDEALSTTLWL